MLAVLPNSKIPEEDLNAFYNYFLKENPKAKEVVDAVLQVFSKSPHTIEEFVANCKKCPLPFDQASYDEFCAKYKQEI